MLSIPVILGTIIGGLGLYFWQQLSRSRKLPPGPRTLPILGNIHQLKNPKGFQSTLLNWAEEYGELFTIWLFGTPVVVINGQDAIREALLTQSVDFADRPQSFSLQYISRGGKVIGLGSFSEEWKTQKKMAATALRMYGDGLQKLEAISQEVLLDFTAHLQESQGAPVNMETEARKAVVNVITSMVFGRRFAWNDPDFDVIEAAIAGVPGISPSRSLLDAFPWIRHIIPLNTWKVLEKTKRLLDDFFDRHLEIIKSNFDPNDIKCFADAIYQHTLQAKPGKSALEYDMFVMTVFGVFVAGFATTSTALTAFILVTLHHPQVEQKLVEEIRAVIGRDRLPCLEDRKNMPYMEACILEILRYASHVPLALPHVTHNDVKFRGYNLPKGTMVFMHLNQLHHDSKEWDKPWDFKPERFIDPESGEVWHPGHPSRQALMPFGAGRRVCIGESLAKNRLFLFLTGLFQKFQFLPIEGKDLPPCDPRQWGFNFILSLPKFKVKIVPRD